MDQLRSITPAFKTNTWQQDEYYRSSTARRQPMPAVFLIRARAGHDGIEEAMNLLCAMGFHSWNGCRCRRENCLRVRDQDHDWSIPCRCSLCFEVRPTNHVVKNCVCTGCRHEVHRWLEISRERVFVEDEYPYIYRTCPTGEERDSVTEKCLACGLEVTRVE